MYEHLLVPVDGAELSERAMTASIELARKLGARITGFIAEPFAAQAPGIVASYGKAVALHDASVQDHARQVMTRFESLARDAGVPFASHSTQANHVGDAILDAAREHGCDMIVMVTHGRGTFGEMLWGSNTKNLMSRCPVPLLVLH